MQNPTVLSNENYAIALAFNPAPAAASIPAYRAASIARYESERIRAEIEAAATTARSPTPAPATQDRQPECLGLCPPK